MSSSTRTTSAPALSVVIPAYQEFARLPATLSRIEEYLDQREMDYEVLVVDDGSSDGTHTVTGQLDGESAFRFRTLRLDSNRGKGAAVRTGVAASTGGRVLITDADLSSPIEELPRLERALERGPVAFGSRALARELITHRQPFYREGMGRLFNRLLRLMGITGVRDTQCGFKLLEGDVARQLFSLMTVDGFAFDVELLLEARGAGIEVSEVPVAWHHVEESRVRVVRHSAQMLFDVMKIRLRHSRRRE